MVRHSNYGRCYVLTFSIFYHHLSPMSNGHSMLCLIWVFSSWYWYKMFRKPLEIGTQLSPWTKRIFLENPTSIVLNISFCSLSFLRQFGCNARPFDTIFQRDITFFFLEDAKFRPRMICSSFIILCTSFFIRFYGYFIALLRSLKSIRCSWTVIILTVLLVHNLSFYDFFSVFSFRKVIFLPLPLLLQLWWIKI